jgi:hypothetical protein
MNKFHPKLLYIATVGDSIVVVVVVVVVFVVGVDI